MFWIPKFYLIHKPFEKYMYLSCKLSWSVDKPMCFFSQQLVIWKSFIVSSLPAAPFSHINIWWMTALDQSTPSLLALAGSTLDTLRFLWFTHTYIIELKEFSRLLLNGHIKVSSLYFICAHIARYTIQTWNFNPFNG